MNQLPTWVQYAQALATPAIAVLAAVIATLQWRTAHQRAVLDLFDRRMGAHVAIRDVISEVVREGRVTHDVHVRYNRACDGTQFLFGPEVQGYLKQLGEDLGAHYVADSAAEHGPPEKRQNSIETKHAKFLRIADFYVEFESLIRPYVRMHQKALGSKKEPGRQPRSPARVLAALLLTLGGSAAVRRL
jgi:hypothetical protein